MPSIDLIRLHLDGFGSYDKLDLPLGDLGTVFVNGPTGSGKSTIPFVIYYLLVGKMIRKKSEFVSVKDFVNKVLDSGYDVSLEFKIDDHICKIREIRDRRSEEEFEKNGLYFFVDEQDKRGKTDQETRKNITEFIKVSDDLNNISFLSKRQSQKMIHGTSADRAKVVVDVFGLERYNELIESCSKEASELEDTRKALKDKIESQQTLISSLGENLSSLDEIEDVSDSLIAGLGDKMLEIENKLSKIEEKEKEANRFIAKAEEIGKHKDKLAALNTEIEDLEEQIKNLPENCDDAAEKKLEERKDKRADLMSAIKFSKEELKRIQKLKNLCPINEEECPVDVPKKHKNERVKKCNESIGANEGLLGAVNDEIVGLEVDVKTLEDHKNSSDSLQEKLKWRNSLEIKEIDEDELNEKEDLLEKCNDGKERGNAKLEWLRTESSDLKSKKLLKEQQEKFVKTTTESIAEANKKIEKHQKSLEEFGITVQYANGVLNIFKKAKVYKIDLVLDFLNESTNEVLKRVSNGKRNVELVSQRQSAKSKTAIDKLGVMVSDSYKTLPIELVSDGQEAQVGLSILFGVWKTANDLSDKKIYFLWLDEVFGPLDSETIERVFETVVELSKEMGTKSIYIISHRDLDCRLFKWEWRTKLTNGISNLTVNRLN